jgi:4-hydroxy-tetrahydrodipicolinate synthase
VAPIPTPFDANDAVDFGAIERNTEKWLGTELSGFVLNSENGEESFLDEAERLEIVRTVARVAAGKKLIVGGVDSPSVTDTIRKSEELISAGADMVRIRIPRLTTNIRSYFEQVLGRVSKPALIIHQPAPGTFAQTQTIGTPRELAELAVMDNVFAYLASGNIRFETVVRHHIPADRRFWIGNGVLLLAGAAIGANGACLMLGNIAPSECLDIIKAGMNADLLTAREIHRRLLGTDYMILGRGAAGIKAALNLQGYEATQPRRPSPPMSDTEISDLRAWMTADGLL